MKPSYFPIQPQKALDNLKEGFEMGSGRARTTTTQSRKDANFNLYEPNVWPSPKSGFSSQTRRDLTKLYSELQTLSAKLLSLLAISLNKPPKYFSCWLDDSLSTLRLLHYPLVNSPTITTNEFDNDDTASISSSTNVSMGEISLADSDISSHNSSVFSAPNHTASTDQNDHFKKTKESIAKLSCTPPTDSGILTLLHQDPTGGLEVLNSTGEWIPAPYIPGSIVVNIGDLMAKVSEVCQI
jgi:isopenicillin N synthase-like dioxygenase